MQERHGQIKDCNDKKRAVEQCRFNYIRVIKVRDIRTVSQKRGEPESAQSVMIVRHLNDNIEFGRRQAEVNILRPELSDLFRGIVRDMPCRSD
ncbi:hypothetical protein SDC9_197243 [bioreactor metagenome]|uniref:Uncharacterized protein n=1 Tax=bioreactor metagenome TaxID=1076179 RepID=A0A645IE64_9ZZZZ